MIKQGYRNKRRDLILKKFNREESVAGQIGIKTNNIIESITIYKALYSLKLCSENGKNIAYKPTLSRRWNNNNKTKKFHVIYIEIYNLRWNWDDCINCHDVSITRTEENVYISYKEAIKILKEVRKELKK